MASDTDSADVTELTERNEDSGLSGVDKKEGNRRSVNTDKEPKTYRQNQSHETAT